MICIGASVIEPGGMYERGVVLGVFDTMYGLLLMIRWHVDRKDRSRDQIGFAYESEVVVEVGP